jgi:hypothetical protein
MIVAFDILALSCATIIFTWGSLFERLRALYPKMLNCPLCCGFWIGLGGHVLRYKMQTVVVDAFYSACVTSVLALGLSLVFDRLVVKS